MTKREIIIQLEKSAVKKKCKDTLRLTPTIMCRVKNRGSLHYIFFSDGN